MYKGSLKNFFLAKTTHRIPKILTLAISSSVLVAMVNIDASASAFGGRDSSAVRTDVVLTLASESSNSQFSGLVKRWETISSPITDPTITTTPIVSGDGGGAGTGGTSGGTGGGGTSGGSGGGGTSGGSGGGGTSGGTGGGSAPVTTTTTTTPPSTTTTTAPPTSSSSSGLITAGPSRSECLEPNIPSGDYGLSYIQSAVSGFDAETNSNVTCVLAYLNGAQTWAQWDDPWVTQAYEGYTAWVAQEPQTRQVVLQVDLIPSSLSDVSNPLSWEQSCAAGNFNSYATTLGQNLVAAGLQHSVLRLGAEMNGAWEADFVGNTTQEQNLWATCFDNEVAGLRQAAGEDFLIDWNPNACYEDIPYANFYPGNAYVDILGLDFYDAGCNSPTTPLTFTQLSNESEGLTNFEAFAAAQGKPMSFPEWGLDSTPSGDDPGYVDGIGSAVENGNFAFQSYFNLDDGGTMPLGSDAPQSTAEYQKWFGNS